MVKQRENEGGGTYAEKGETFLFTFLLVFPSILSSSHIRRGTHEHS